MCLRECFSFSYYKGRFEERKIMAIHCVILRNNLRKALEDSRFSLSNEIALCFLLMEILLKPKNSQHKEKKSAHSCKQSNPGIEITIKTRKTEQKYLSPQFFWRSRYVSPRSPSNSFYHFQSSRTYFFILV